MSRSRIIRADSLQQFQAIQVLSDPGAVGGPVVIPNCTQVVLNWNIASGRQGHNVLYARSAGVPNPSVAQAQALFAAMTTGGLWTAMASHIATVCSFTGVTLTSVHSPGQPSFSSTGAAVPGTNATLPLPGELALVTTLRTGLRGLANRGRIYQTGMTVDQVIGTAVASASLQSDQQAWHNGFIAIFSGQSLTWVIGQRARAEYTGSTGTLHPARAATSVPITQAVVRNATWDSQRRRGLK